MWIFLKKLIYFFEILKKAIFGNVLFIKINESIKGLNNFIQKFKIDINNNSNNLNTSSINIYELYEKEYLQKYSNFSFIKEINLFYNKYDKEKDNEKYDYSQDYKKIDTINDNVSIGFISCFSNESIMNYNNNNSNINDIGEIGYLDNDMVMNLSIIKNSKIVPFFQKIIPFYLMNR